MHQDVPHLAAFRLAPGCRFLTLPHPFYGDEHMAKKSTNFNKTNIPKLPDDKPAVYRIQTEGGKDNYIGIAKRGRVTERIAEHLGEVPGAKVKIEQHSSVQDAKASEARLIKRQQPKYNKDGK